MKNKLYFRLGLLVTAAFILLIGMLLFFGMKKQFAPRIRMVTTFQESVQGLTVGAQVKLLGVPVGTVEALKILPEERLIQVDMSIDPSAFQRKAGETSQEHLENVRTLLNAAVENGLQCRLEMSGVTGMRYVEMSYLPKDKQRADPLPKPKDTDAIYIASAPGTFNNIIDSVGETMTKVAQIDFLEISKKLDGVIDSSGKTMEQVAQIDFVEISRKMDGTLSDLQNILSDPSLKNSIGKINDIANNFDTISRNFSENVTGEEIRRLLENSNLTMTEIHTLSAKLQQKLEDIDTGRIGAETAETLQSIRSLSSEIARTRIGVERTLQHFNSFLAGTGELVDLLKRDPNALLRGKSAVPLNL